ncbi:uncharacterized protein LOC122506333 [Leptopilina heterotoma]|uniref:uncharacterized protein LOC122506333 n=1 Tax=Leptopilina heterotoma TaxID=63436 RepID=UPI001CA9F1AF|nr:uncharacterized protein LOC122506333 [Leptopilina heterotoma]
MASRDNNVFLKGGRLFQQWIVDSYVKIEKDRRNFSRNNQKKLRADTYEGLIDHLQKRANDLNNEVGKIVILLSSFTGSPRNMLQHYQDAMAIEQLFGEVIAYVYVIEYQKRGLPHMHLLVTLKQNYKITTPEIVDKYISAEIPSQSENVILHDIVMKNMIHGSCGNWCKDNNSKCLKGFPKQFCSVTIMDENGYLTYRCLNTGQYDHLNGGTTDNQYVIPYNPTLLQLFNCHINVEVVSTCDRIFGRPLQSKSHSILRLPVHLINRHTVTISEEANDDAINEALQKRTMLLEYFDLNRRDPQARQYTYAEIPCYYVFKKEGGENALKWVKRKGSFNVIRRMYSISPSQSELFHLRLLLIVVKGATSYDDLRTVKNILHAIFRSACLALGLIEDDGEWERALTEGEVWMMPQQLRRLFVQNQANNEMSLQQHKEIGEMQYVKLNSKQKDIVDEVLNVVIQDKRIPSSSCYYIDGPGGMSLQRMMVGVTIDIRAHSRK